MLPTPSLCVRSVRCLHQVLISGSLNVSQCPADRLSSAAKEEEESMTMGREQSRRMLPN